MLDWNAYFLALGFNAIIAVVAWLYSVWRRNVAIVDTLWSLMILAVPAVYLLAIGGNGLRGAVVLALIAAWALRLSLHIMVRNHGQPEDHRYQAIRRNNEPHFWFKSLYIVFGLQAFLAWFIALPAVAVVASTTAPGWLELAAMAVWGVGMFFEVVGDWQLMRFQRSPRSAGAVLDSGLWRYSRHPNYFGEALLWWGVYLAALAAGAWWSVASPLLMTFLLLRVSGVAMLERDIADRRPAYQDYIRRTNAFFPAPPRTDGPPGALKGA